MAQVTITHIDRGLPLGLPYIIYVDGQAVGMMQMPQARMNLPAGKHSLMVRCGGYFRLPFTKKTFSAFVEAFDTIDVQEEQYTEVQFENREKWWNILFDVDLVLWLVRIFATIPEPWGLVYDVVSNVSFALWLVHFYLYRKRYFRFRVTHSATPPAEVHPSDFQRKLLEMQQKRNKQKN